MFVLKQAHAGRRVLSLVCQNGHVNHKKKKKTFLPRAKQAGPSLYPVGPFMMKVALSKMHVFGKSLTSKHGSVVII